MEWAERLGDTQVTEDVPSKLGIQEGTTKNIEPAMSTFMKNFTAGHTKEVIQHGVDNGIDAWGKLFGDQLPVADYKRNILMTERITNNWGRLASRPFDEEATVGKLREPIPSQIWNYIAQGARGARTYRELVALVMNQMTDPKTGMLQGEKLLTLRASRRGLT